jgi:hypothetical protein
MGMFEKYTKTKVVTMCIAYSSSSKPYQPIKEWLVMSRVSLCKRRLIITKLDEDGYLQNLFSGNELVGVDEKIMYLPIEPVNALNVVRCSDNLEML